MFQENLCLLVTEGGLQPNAAQTRSLRRGPRGPRAAVPAGAGADACPPRPRARLASWQEEEAGAAAPADGLLLPAVEDLQPELLLPLQVLRSAGGPDAGEHGPGDAGCFPGTEFS